MDGSRFDSLLRALATTPSRRSAIRLAAAPILGGLVVHDVLPTEAKKKKKLTLCHQGQTISVSKKKKKTHLKHGDTPGACQPGCAPNCADKQCGPDGCGSVCGACTAAGQSCTPSGQCVCPVGQPEICGGACLASCPPGTARDPSNCGCCVGNNGLDGGTPANCCSRLSVGGKCVGLDAGSRCTVDDQCADGGCVNGVCTCPAPTRYCPQQRRCEECCSDAECGPFEVCASDSGEPDHCVCKVPPACIGTCLQPGCPAGACGAQCNPNAPACCPPLTCQPDSPATHSCLPPP